MRREESRREIALCRAIRVYLMLSLTIYDQAHVASENACGFRPIRSRWDVGGTLTNGGSPRELRSHWWRFVWIAFCAECFLVALITDRFILASSLLVGSFGGILWQFLVDPPQWKGRRLKPHAVTVALVLAVFLGVVVPLFRSHFSAGDGIGTPPGSSVKLKQMTSDTIHTSYQGVILWPQMPRKAKVVPPPPHQQAVAAMSISKPLVIPFHGSYWYFRDPAKRPSSNAHIMHGLPTEVAIHSTDFHRLIMEAHQDLDSPIELTCCREIDLKILNADNIPGGISISLVLTDSTVRGSASQTLGSHNVKSSEPPIFSLSRPPVKETLRFIIPAQVRIKRFDELSVVLQPSLERSLGGVKISIQEFRLLPAY
jgi:hypothetical protein